MPGADGAPVTWRSLLALGIAGGLLPCPSALVVMLGAIALHQVGFGLVLIVFFSAGLAATLMAIGLLMVYSGRTAGKLRLVERLGSGRAAGLARLARLVPVLSAGVVALAGLALSVEALRQIDLSDFWSSSPALRMVTANALSLGLGALVVFVALRRRSSRSTPAAVPVVLAATLASVASATHNSPSHAAHHHDRHAPVPPAHGHAHEHAHDHLHGHAHDHDHSHDHSEVHEHVTATVGGRAVR